MLLRVYAWLCLGIIPGSAGAGEPYVMLGIEMGLSAWKHKFYLTAQKGKLLTRRLSECSVR